MVERISDSSIVKGRKRVLPAGHPLIAIYDPSEIEIVGEISEYDYVGKSFPAGSAFLKVGASDFAVTTPETELDKLNFFKKQEPLDVPQPIDIESVVLTKYFDPVTKVEKAKAVIKIRNSSINKSKVSGVDARIYQPRGI